MNFDLLTSGKESPWNFCHFGPKIIENGQVGVELGYFLVLSSNIVPYGTIRYYHMVPYGTIRYYHKVP